MIKQFTFTGEVAGARHLLPVLMKLPFPLVDVGGALLKRGRQSQVVGFECRQFHLPFLSVRRTGIKERFTISDMIPGVA